MRLDRTSTWEAAVWFSKAERDQAFMQSVADLSLCHNDKAWSAQELFWLCGLRVKLRIQGWIADGLLEIAPVHKHHGNHERYRLTDAGWAVLDRLHIVAKAQV